MTPASPGVPAGAQGSKHLSGHHNPSSPVLARTRSPTPTLAPLRLPETGVEIDAEIELARTSTRASSASQATQPPATINSNNAGEKALTLSSTDGTAATPTCSGTGDVGAAEAGKPPPDIYDRFSPHRKHIMIAVVSFSGFLGPVASSAFLPSIGVMAEELNTTPEIINYTVAIFIVTIGIAPLVWSPLSAFYGRRPVYLLSMPIMTVASIGVAQSHTIAQLIGTRILQGIGSSSVLAVGAGTIGDLYRPTERANAMSWYYSGIVIGPALSPVIAGIFTEYTPITWRATQYFLCACSALSVLCTALFLPETSHPPLPHDTIRRQRGRRFVPYWFNPIRCLLLMRHLNLVTITLTSCLVMLELYCIWIPLATVFKERYNLENVALAGCVYLASGAGTLLGARITGPYADRVVRKWIEKRGYRAPEDRLRAALIGTGIILPGSCLAYGWLLWGNRGGMAPPIIMLAINGVGTQTYFTPINTYIVDAMQKRSAEAIAANNFFRYLFAAAASAFVLPMINSIGLGWTMTVGAVCVWIALALILLTIRFGGGWNHYDTEKETSVETKQAKTLDGKGPGSVDGVDGEIDYSTSEQEGTLDLPTSPAATAPRQTSNYNRPLSRHSSVISLPTAGDVLKRTVSLTAASVHG